MTNHEKKMIRICTIVVALVFILFGILLSRFQISIQLNGSDAIVHECGVPYVDSGARAFCSNFLGEVEPELTVSGEVDWTTVGSYTLTYTAKRGAAVTSAIRTVTVVDTTPPEITLLGDSVISLQESIGTYAEPGWTASDSVDGDLTAQVQISGDMDLAACGSYLLTYTVQDSAGNSAEATRTVVVENLHQPDVIDIPSEKVVYLTFDDGPGPYTRQLLDVLKKYNVKATFFVVNTKYRDIMADEAAEGHTVAIHSATHNYYSIYASKDAYFRDLQTIQDEIIRQTGKPAELLRFPGGSSNGVSRFNPGIMTVLTSAVQNQGFHYVDWNVDSGDASNAKDAKTVAARVIEGMQKQQSKGAVVLQHDIKSFSVDAVEEIVRWGIMNGYTFLPMTKDSPTAHQRVIN